MKPTITVINIYVSVTRDTDRRCPRQRTVSPYTFQNSLRVCVFLLIGLIADGTGHAQAQTSIVGIRTANTIVIGSDGLNRNRFTGETKKRCKIQQIKNVVFSAASSYGENPQTNFSVWDIAREACQEEGTVQEKMKRFVATVEPRLVAELERMRNISLDAYRKSVENKIMLQAMIAGFDNNVPVLLIREFVLTNTDTSPVLFRVIPTNCPGDCSPKATGLTIYAVGFRDHMLPYLNAFIAKNRPLKPDALPQAAREAIGSEMGKHPEVGGELHVLRMTPTRFEWIGPHPDCPDIEQPAKRPANKRPRR
jgi:hypothetical protein